MAQPTLAKLVPWTKAPILINAPMGGFAGGRLASAVTLSGGLGMIGAVFDMEALKSELRTAADAFAVTSNTTLRVSQNSGGSETLPLGVGLLPFVLKIEDALPVIKKFRPRVVWLFAAKELDDYAEWAEQIRKVSPGSMIWIQCGSVASAVQIARTAKPDVLCLQGADAGGHGFEKGASIISLLPEAVDALARAECGHIPLVAAGGIADGRGVAAALALGAQGVVMGTRFLAAEETTIHTSYRSAVLEAEDGGQATTRSKLFDNLRGPNIWPELYDGRSIIMQSYTDQINGMELDEIRRLHNEALEGEAKGYATGGKGRAAIWAGTGLGLVREVQSAKDIVEGVRKETWDALGRLPRI